MVIREKLIMIVAGLCIVSGLMGYAVTGFGLEGLNEGVAYERIWELDSEQLDRLSIQSDYNVLVQFVPSEDGRNTVHLRGKVHEEVLSQLEQTKVTHNKLNLLLKRPKRIEFKYLDFTGIDEQIITVALTDEKLIKSLEAELGSSQITIKNGILNYLDVRVGSGQVSIEQMEAEKLDLQVSSGNMELSDILGSVEAKVGSGSIKVNKVQGNFKAEGSSGSITGSDITGDIDVQVRSGNIRLENTLGKVRVETTSGDIRLDQKAVSETLATTSSGNIRIFVPRDFAGFYDAQARSGSIRTPESKRETDQYIKARTNSGDIGIELR
ncbi:DUF4097 family beta strand repeat-containing protein [Caldalkalibacillus mannanilyticus]|uniref:DUF4097 family beta strand repeat-containing protein n=1 Tax=Caldalkalibacillus mannanilyticus TaxID=1418 RepID=UPI000468FBE8|nr:DUF4097 family beta strand repeat-containing protein [Caldalkalibacillus mannanilyticus]